MRHIPIISFHFQKQLNYIKVLKYRTHLEIMESGEENVNRGTDHTVTFHLSTLQEADFYAALTGKGTKQCNPNRQICLTWLYDIKYV